MAELELHPSQQMLVVPDSWFWAVRQRLTELTPGDLPAFERIDHPYDHGKVGPEAYTLAAEALRRLVATMRARARATLGRGNAGNWPGLDEAVDAVLRRQWAELDLTLAVLALLDEGVATGSLLVIQGD